MSYVSSAVYNGSSSGGNEYGTPASWSVDLGSGSDRALLVEVAVPNRNLAALSLTVGGVACNQSSVYTRAVNGKYVFFWLSGATLPEGAQTFVLTTEAGDNLGRPRALVTIYNGVAAVTAPVVANSSGSAPSVTAASANGHTVVTLGMWDVGSSATVTDPSVERNEIADSLLVAYVMDRASTGATTTTAATLSAGNYFVLGAFDLTPTPPPSVLSGNVGASSVDVAGTLADAGPTSLAGSVTLDAVTVAGTLGAQPGVITTDPIAFPLTGALAALRNFPWVTALRLSDGVQQAVLTNVMSSAGAVLQVTHGFITPGQSYALVGYDGTVACCGIYLAA